MRILRLALGLGSPLGKDPINKEDSCGWVVVAVVVTRKSPHCVDTA